MVLAIQRARKGKERKGRTSRGIEIGTGIGTEKRTGKGTEIEKGIETRIVIVTIETATGIGVIEENGAGIGVTMIITVAEILRGNNI